jgi:DNA-binding CsgD family transcriptional regulator
VRLGYLGHAAVNVPTPGPEACAGERPAHRMVLLTRRQEQVGSLLLRGYTSSEIAAELGIQNRTLKAHLAHMYGLLGITGGAKRVQLATLLFRGLRDVPVAPCGKAGWPCPFAASHLHALPAGPSSS